MLYMIQKYNTGPYRRLRIPVCCVDVGDVNDVMTDPVEDFQVRHAYGGEPNRGWMLLLLDLRSVSIVL